MSAILQCMLSGIKKSTWRNLWIVPVWDVTVIPHAKIGVIFTFSVNQRITEKEKTTSARDNFRFAILFFLKKPWLQLGRVLKPCWSAPVTVILSVKIVSEQCHGRMIEANYPKHSCENIVPSLDATLTTQKSQKIISEKRQMGVIHLGKMSSSNQYNTEWRKKIDIIKAKWLQDCGRWFLVPRSWRCVIDETSQQTGCYIWSYLSTNVTLNEGKKSDN